MLVFSWNLVAVLKSSLQRLNIQIQALINILSFSVLVTYLIVLLNYSAHFWKSKPIVIKHNKPTGACMLLVCFIQACMDSIKSQLSVCDDSKVLKGNHLLPTGSLMAIAAVVYQLTNWRGCPHSVLCRACCFAHLVWQIASLWRMQGLGAVLTYDISFVSDKWPFSGGAWFTWEAIARYESPPSVTSEKATAFQDLARNCCFI